MTSRKAYIILLVSIIIYSLFMNGYVHSGIIRFVITIWLLFWLLYPLFFANQNKGVMPFQDDSHAQSVFKIFIIWQAIVILRGVLFNYGIINTIMSRLGNPYSLFAYLMPLVVFLKPHRFNFRAFTSILMYLGVLFFYYVFSSRGHLFDQSVIDVDSMMLTQQDIENRNTWLYNVMFVGKIFASIGFLMFLPSFIGKKRYWFVIVCWAIALFSCIMGGRRGQSLTLILMGLLSFYFYENGNKRFGRNFRYFLLVSVVIAIGIYIYSSNAGMFAIMSSRLTDDSRTFMFAEFWSDMINGVGWLFGRGLGGLYYSPISYGEEMVQYRDGIECGLFQLVLTGGIISMFLYISVLLRAAIKGFFHSNNQLTKAFAAYIGVSLFNLLPFGVPECNVSFFVVWLGVAICSSPYYRSLTDTDVKKLFK